jgi:biopolymer transport protein ExbB
MALLAWWNQADFIARAVAVLLLSMSVASWVLIVWRLSVLPRAGAALTRASAAFWQSPDARAGREAARRYDTLGVLVPMIDAALAPEPSGSLAAEADPALRVTRALREALHRSLANLQRGQVVLATIGATAPFVGLLGTVWGIHQALLALGAGGAVTIERVAAPVGEALVMTAAGLAVAIPAVLAYNALGRRIAELEGALEGFAHDLRELLTH